MKVLVIAAHPDDEVLGCGGTIAKHARNGDEVHVMILAEGLTSRGSARDVAANSGSLSELAQAAHRANDILGVKSLALHGLPDNRLDSLDRLDVIKVIEKKVDEFAPAIVYTHHAGDMNIDHRIIHDAVNTACRPTPGHPVKSLFYFEVASSTEWQIPGSATPFLPTWFINISETFELKMDALRAYDSEMRAWPHPRSLDAVGHLARWRGASVGVAAAESFILGRAIS
jgi:LmbE family N-acetylglucosaminyl deacetylase